MALPKRENAPGIGVDVGATLAKLAVRSSEGELQLELMDANELDPLIGKINGLPRLPLGLTGCGAERLAARLDLEIHRSNEFEAWGRGARLLLERQQKAAQEPYLLVSMGTGTSMLRVDEDRTTRLGGTALGGGTVVGLGRVLAGVDNHSALCELALRGKRDRVDLLIQHIYPGGVAGLPPEATAASFGLLARGPNLNAPTENRPADLAAAVIGLVAENVALQSSALAQAAGLSSVVYGGSTLLDNPLLQILLAGITAASGKETILLLDGGYAGALGALEFAAE